MHQKSGWIITSTILKKNTHRSYSVVMGKLCEDYGDYQHSELTVDIIIDFLNQLTEGCKPQTKCVRYGQFTAYFNFIKNNIICDFVSPCDSKMLRKLYRPKITIQWDILEIVSKVILRHSNLATTQMYLGKISDAEAMKWIENMYA